ncbi:Hint domain-containing protein [Swingsia samuiensis]|uniref:Hedgehog/Intein (Hint) domain-containing protein n=1 Tax=Swingsia samuiensis TaxID=1293412 RepID=A0A4Y6UJD2_9PROT|nr:Hint domain-containing protein [Swingsia samuiensis]QDH16748.1 hypothetical protein E3D00_03575 [Swingsia samuiensis]
MAITISSGQFKGTPPRSGIESSYRLSSGENQSDMTILAGGYVYEDAGVTITNLTLEAASGSAPGGHLDGDSGKLLPNDAPSSSAAVVNGKVENHGLLGYVWMTGSETIYSGGSDTTVWVRNGGSRTILSGGKAVGGSVLNGGIDYVSSGGVVDGASIRPGGIRNLYAGGHQIGGVNVWSGAVLNVASGADVSGTSSDAISVSSGGLISGILTQNTNGISGSILSGVIVNNGTISSTVVNGSGTVENVGSTGRIVDQWVANSAVRNVSSGGVVSNGTIISGGVDNILAGGSAVSGAISQNGTRNLQSGAVNTDPQVRYGVLNVSSGAIVDSANVQTSGRIVADSAGILTGAIQNSGQISGGLVKGSETIVSGGVHSGGEVASGGQVTVLSGGGFASGQIDSGGLVTVSQGLISRTNISGGTAIIYGKNPDDNGVTNGLHWTGSHGSAVLNNTVWNNGARPSTIPPVDSTGTGNGLNKDNTIILNSGGSWRHAYMNATAHSIVNNSGIAEDIYMVGGDMAVNSGGVALNGTVASGAVINVASDGMLSGSTDSSFNVLSSGLISGQYTSNADGNGISGSILSGLFSNAGTISKTALVGGDSVERVQSGGRVVDQWVAGATRVVSSGAVVSNGVVISNGVDTVLAGGSAVAGAVSQLGTRYIQSGGFASDQAIRTSGTLVAASGAVVSNAAITDSTGKINADTAAVLSGYIANSGQVSGGLLKGSETIFSGAVHTSGIVTSGGQIAVSGGGLADNIYMSGGKMQVSSGGVARNGVVASGAVVNVDYHGVVSGSNDQGYTVLSNGLINGPRPSSLEDATTGATLSGLIINAGTISGTALLGSGSVERVSAGATTVDQAVAMSAVRNVSSGAVVSNGRISSNGIDNIRSGAVAISGSIAEQGVRNLETGAVNIDPQVRSGGTVNVASGAIVNSGLVQPSGQILANSAGVFSGLISNGGLISGGLVKGSETIVSGGRHSAGEVVSGGQVTVSSGGTFVSGQIDSGGLVTVSQGLISATNISGGTAVIYGSGPETNGVTNGLHWTGSNGSAVLHNTLWDNGSLPSRIPPVDSTGSGNGLNKNNTIILNSGATWRHAYMNATAHNVVNSGGTSDDIYMVGGDMVVNSGGKIGSSGATVGSGAVLTVSSGGTIDGTVQLVSGGSATVDKNAGGIIDMNGDKNTGLVITGLENGGTFTTRVTGFNGTKPESSNSGLSQAAGGDSDGIVLAGVKQADVKSVTYPDDNHVQIALKNGSIINLNVDNAKKQGFSLVSSHNRSGVQDGTLVYEVCFLAGSMIRTPSGETAVEEMKIGDVVQTLDAVSGTMVSKTVTWVGHKHADVDVTASDEDAGYPVRVLKDALGENVPSQDLLITAEHSLFVEGRFVPVRMLVNGRSIFYDRSFVSYDYYHVETEEHSVIWANNAPTESYLDTGNRRSFAQSGQVVDLSAGASAKSWASDAAVPLEVSRAFVEPVYHRLMARAIEAGVAAQTADRQVTHEHNLHLVTKDGQVLKAVRHSHDRVVFSLPPQTDGIRLVSRVGRPSVAVGPFVDDRRDLGVLIGEMVVLNAQSRHEVGAHLEQADLSGWDVQESSPCRWTQGNAYVPVKTGKDFSLFSVQVLAAGPYVLEEDASVSSVASISA